mmetsp:Transcript_13072/g.54752  ORF Transcript_13072/g.54752 Transcript_13072/m.54752 type:complete len:441 (+) Transcript_13072:252-1574(+)
MGRHQRVSAPSVLRVGPGGGHRRGPRRRQSRAAPRAGCARRRLRLPVWLLLARDGGKLGRARRRARAQKPRRRERERCARQCGRRGGDGHQRQYLPVHWLSPHRRRLRWTARRGRLWDGCMRCVAARGHRGRLRRRCQLRTRARARGWRRDGHRRREVVGGCDRRNGQGQCAFFLRGMDGRKFACRCARRIALHAERRGRCGQHRAAWGGEVLHTWRSAPSGAATARGCAGGGGDARRGHDSGSERWPGLGGSVRCPHAARRSGGHARGGARGACGQRGGVSLSFRRGGGDAAARRHAAGEVGRHGGGIRRLRARSRGLPLGRCPAAHCCARDGSRCRRGEWRRLHSQRRGVPRRGRCRQEAVAGELRPPRRERGHLRRAAKSGKEVAQCPLSCEPRVAPGARHRAAGGSGRREQRGGSGRGDRALRARRGGAFGVVARQ